MSYPGTTPQLVLSDPNDPTKRAPVDKIEGLTVQPSPSMYELMLMQTNLMASMVYLLSQIGDIPVDPEEALKEIYPT